MSNQDYMAEIEKAEAEERNGHIEMGEALNRLKENPDFKMVILEGYLKREVLNSVSLLSVPQISEKGKRPGVMEDLISASNLQYFFQVIDSFYQGAIDPILTDEERAQLEQEGDA